MRHFPNHNHGHRRRFRRKKLQQQRQNPGNREDFACESQISFFLIFSSFFFIFLFLIFSFFSVFSSFLHLSIIVDIFNFSLFLFHFVFPFHFPFPCFFFSFFPFVYFFFLFSFSVGWCSVCLACGCFRWRPWPSDRRVMRCLTSEKAENSSEEESAEPGELFSCRSEITHKNSL